MRTEGDDPRSDADLLAAIGAKDEGACRYFYDRHASWLRPCLIRRAGDPGIVEDALQATFVAVLQKPEAWRGDGEVAAWLRRIAVHKLQDELRRRSRVWQRIVFMTDKLLDDHGRAARSAEEELLIRDGVAYGEWGAALRKLSPALRDVVDCCVLGGLTTREAAMALGVPHGTVKSRLSRARDRLRELIDPPTPGPAPSRAIRGSRSEDRDRSGNEAGREGLGTSRSDSRNSARRTSGSASRKDCRRQPVRRPREELT